MLPRILKGGQRGFSLVEMAVVIAILGVLAAVATPLLVIYLGGAQERAYEADLGIVQESVDAFFSAPNNFRFQGKNQYPIIGRGETDRTGHTVRTASFPHPDDGAPLAASQRDAVAGADKPDWNPLGGTQGADLLKAGATPTYKIAWTDDGDGVREILVATSETTRSPDTWTTIQVSREGVTYYVDPRYYFVDMDALVSARLLREVPKSSSLDNSATGTGSFTYYVDDKGKVQTLPFDFPRTNGFQKVATTPTATPTPAGTLLATITTGPSPGGVAVNPSTNRLYVASGGANAVQVFDATTYALVTSIAVGNGPSTMALNPVTSRLYVLNSSCTNTISVIDTTSNTVVTTIARGGPTCNSGSFAIDTTANLVYTSNHEGHMVEVINGASNAIVASVPVGGIKPADLRVNEVTHRLYVANTRSDTVSVIDTTNNTLITTIASAGFPQGMALNATTNRVYVSNSGSNSISVIDGSTNTVTARIDLGPYQTVNGGPGWAAVHPFGMEVNAASARLYVALTVTNQLAIIDTTTNAVLTRAAVGTSPSHVALFGGKAFVTNGGGTVSVIAQ